MCLEDKRETLKPSQFNVKDASSAVRTDEMCLKLWFSPLPSAQRLNRLT